jgi:ferric-dicitrate binding protein FerR (iron transport regulator)
VSSSEKRGGAGGRPLAAGALLPAGAEVSTGRDGRLALRVVDGPSLRLDVGSRLTLVAADRVLLSAGAVYVDSEGGMPVTVQTPWGEVEERGTQFEVRLAGEAVRVRVREGAVSLAGDARRWQAEAGVELVLTADGRLSRGSVPFHGQAWRWVQEIAPTFRLEGRSLPEFLAWVGRETGWQVRWRDGGTLPDGIGGVLHGSVEGMPPEQALAAVLPTCGLAHRLDGGTVILFPNAP